MDDFADDFAKEIPMELIQGVKQSNDMALLMDNNDENDDGDDEGNSSNDEDEKGNGNGKEEEEDNSDSDDNNENENKKKNKKDEENKGDKIIFEGKNILDSSEKPKKKVLKKKYLLQDGRLIDGFSNLMVFNLLRR